MPPDDFDFGPKTGHFMAFSTNRRQTSRKRRSGQRRTPALWKSCLRRARCTTSSGMRGSLPWRPAQGPPLTGHTSNLAGEVDRGGLLLAHGHKPRRDRQNRRALRRGCEGLARLSEHTGEFPLCAAQIMPGSPRAYIHRPPDTPSTSCARQNRRPTSLIFDEIRLVSLHVWTERCWSRRRRGGVCKGTPRPYEDRLRDGRRTAPSGTRGISPRRTVKGGPWTTDSPESIFDVARGGSEGS